MRYIILVSLPCTVKDDCDVDGFSPCKNGGECIDELAAYFCSCTANYTGINCTKPGKDWSG